MTDDATLTHDLTSDPTSATDPVAPDATFDLTESEDFEEEEIDRPWLRPGQWYVVHSQSGYEQKVKLNMNARIASMHMESKIYEIVIPMEDVVEFKVSQADRAEESIPWILACPLRHG